MAMKHNEAIDACDWLRRDYEGGGLIEKNKQYEQTYQLNSPPKLGDEVSRGRTIYYPVPRISEFVSGLTAQVLGYQTFPVLTPQSDDLTPTEADRLEAAVSLMLAEVNEGQGITARAYRGFLRRSHVVYQAIQGNPTDRVPFRVDLPRLNTVFFERFPGGRPAMVSRQYQMLARDLGSKYSNKRGEHDGANQLASWDSAGKRMRYRAVSGEYSRDDSMTGSAMVPHAEKVEVKELYDGEWCYHFVKGLGYGRSSAYAGYQQDWQEVLRYKETTAGVPFWVQPSNPQDDELWSEDWRPIAWPLYTRVMQIERIETIRASRAEQVQSHIITRLPPDQQAAVEKLKMGGYTPVLHGGVNFIPMAADEVYFWEQQPDADLAIRSQSLKEEMERFIASYQFPATDETIKGANVGTAQIGMQVVHQQESALLINHTRGMAAMAQMMTHALSGDYLRPERELYAKDETHYGRQGAKKVEAGKSVSLPASLMKKVKVYGPEANTRIEVVTRSETESELAQREASVWNNVQRRVQTMDEFIAIRNPDVAGQHKALAKDGMRRDLAAAYDQFVPVVAKQRLLEGWGIDIDAVMRPPDVPPGQAAAPTGAAPMGEAGGGGGTTVLQAAPPTGGADISSAGGAMAPGAMA
jgi:hypothetical protein